MAIWYTELQMLRLCSGDWSALWCVFGCVILARGLSNVRLLSFITCGLDRSGLWLALRQL